MAELTPYVEPVAGSAVAYEAESPLEQTRDPFSPVSLYVTEAPLAPDRPVAAPEPRWVASAILITQDRRSAVVDDQIVSVGDVLGGGARVVAIEREHVEIVTPAGVRRRLTVQPGGSQ